MNKLLFVLLIIALAAIGAFAQPAPGGDAGAGGPGGGNRGGGGGGFLGGSTGTMVNTAKGVFALRDGILVKFDLKTVKLQGNTLELFGPMPKRPEGDRRANAEAFRAWGAELAQRSAPAIMIPKDDALIIVIGTSFSV